MLTLRHVMLRYMRVENTHHTGRIWVFEWSALLVMGSLLLAYPLSRLG